MYLGTTPFLFSSLPEFRLESSRTLFGPKMELFFLSKDIFPALVFPSTGALTSEAFQHEVGLSLWFVTLRY